MVDSNPSKPCSIGYITCGDNEIRMKNFFLNYLFYIKIINSTRENTPGYNYFS